MEDPVSLSMGAIKMGAYSSGMRLGRRTLLPVPSPVRIVADVHIENTYSTCCQRVRYRNTETVGAARTSVLGSICRFKQLPWHKTKRN